MSSKNWILTLNTDVIISDPLCLPAELPGELVFAEPGHVVQSVVQLERCPTTGRAHYQGYLRLDIKCRIQRAKTVIGNNTVHLEPRAGTHEQAAAYCSKEETRVAGPWRFGVDPIGGKRKDLSEVTESIYSGTPLREIMRDQPAVYCQYRNGLRDLVCDSIRDRASAWRTLDVVVYYGPAGCGKTRRAVESGGSDYFILDHSERVWFDGYEGESTLIIDDFYGWIKYHYILRLLDGYKVRLEIKGGFTYALWTKVILTSNKHPNEWYNCFGQQDGMTAALSRRINTIVAME